MAVQVSTAAVFAASAQYCTTRAPRVSSDCSGLSAVALAVATVKGRNVGSRAGYGTLPPLTGVVVGHDGTDRPVNEPHPQLCSRWGVVHGPEHGGGPFLGHALHHGVSTGQRG